MTKVVSWRALTLLFDVLAAGLVSVLTLFVVLNFASATRGMAVVAVIMVLSVAALRYVEAPRQIWRRVSLMDLVSLVIAAVMVAAGTSLLSLMVFSPSVAIRILLGLIPVLTAAWAGPRVTWRMWRDYQEAAAGAGDEENGPEPIILYGSGARADMFLRANQVSRRFNVIGFLHDDERLQGLRLRGVRAFGPLENLPRLLAYAERWGIRPRRLVFAGDGERLDELRIALDAAAANGMRLARLPNLISLLEGSVTTLRPVSIDDILGRSQVRLHDPLVDHCFSGSTLLVTGAGGSIGSELVRQVASLSPAKIVLVDACEYNLYMIDKELARTFPRLERISALVDVRDLPGLRRLFEEHSPELILHAAALKHVPLLEENPASAVLTNVLGTINLARLACEFKVRAMTFVSTDKAVNPTNVMGCTKRWGEIICQAHDAKMRRAGARTRFTCVRFGNVLDSAGSVVPLFREQIARGGPVTVTHKDVTRFFMTIPEACQLILTAMAAAHETELEDGYVFVLEMGEPVRIVALAEQMIQLHGLRPGIDVKIEYVGLRPGEKLHEELAHRAEKLSPAPIAQAHLASSRAPSLAEVEAASSDLIAAAHAGRPDEIVTALRRLVPEFVPQSWGAGDGAVTVRPPRLAQLAGG